VGGAGGGGPRPLPPRDLSAVAVDQYEGTGARWRSGATLVYGPIAAELVALSPHALTGHTVLDVGAGTGAASTALIARKARPIAVDLSADMLASWAPPRPPRALADVGALPLSNHAVDDVVAAFVLNHLPDPAAGLSELIRVTRPAGALLATVFANASHSAVRDALDEVARGAGWQPPAWYRELKRAVIPLLGTARAMRAAARTAGLADVEVQERPVDVGVHRPEQLVAYRFGHPAFSAWLAGLAPGDRARVHQEAVEAIRPIMVPYTPLVIFLAGRTR
jgi:SAM-dependent methyltransferase